jgi:hypothetical protein
VEGVLGDFAAGTESAAIAPPLQTTGVIVDVPLFQTVEAAVTAPTPSMVGAVEEVVEVVVSSSVQPTAAVEEEEGASEMSQPAAVLQERHAPEGMARSTSSEIQDVESPRAHPCREMSEVVTPESLISLASHGWRPLRSATTSWTTRRPRSATPSSTD